MRFNPSRFTYSLCFLFLIGGALACNGKGKSRASADAPATGDATGAPSTDPSVTPDTTGTETSVTTTDVATTNVSTSTGPGKSWSECYTAGKAWYPAPAPAVCGEGTLVTWPCCKEQVLARFPSSDPTKDDVGASFTASAGYDLFACEALPTGETRLHWKKLVSNGLSYRWTTITGAAISPSGTITCAIPPAVPPAGDANLVDPAMP